MKIKLVILVLALQIAWLIGTAMQQENTLRVGRTVLLETRPVDPRDPLRGDYVRLNYQISDVPVNLFITPVNTNQPYGIKIYVALAPSGTNPFWSITRASTEKIPPAANEIVLRGKTAWTWRNNAGTIHVEYGIEQYFVAEGTGNPNGKLTALVAVDRSGSGRIKQVFVDGKPYVDAMKTMAP